MVQEGDEEMMNNGFDMEGKSERRGGFILVKDSGYIKGSWLFLLAILVIALLAGYGFYLNRSLNKKVENVNETGTLSEGTSSSNEPKSFEDIHKKIRGFSTDNNDLNPAQSRTDSIREHLNRGLKYSFSKNYDNAIKEFEEVLRLNPNSAEAYSNIGFAYFDKGDIDNAIAKHKKAIALNPKLANAYYGLALAYERKNMVGEAIDNWNRYIELAPPGGLWRRKAEERLNRLKSLQGGSSKQD